MPEKYGKYAKYVNIIQDTYKDDPDFQEARRRMHWHLTPYTKWTVKDLKELARSESPMAGGMYKECELYNDVIDIYLEVQNNGRNAKDAKDALAAIAPNSCKGNYKAFMAMIKQANDELDREDMGVYYDDYKAVKPFIKNDWDKPDLTLLAKNNPKIFKRLLSIADGVFYPKGDAEKAGIALDAVLPKDFTRKDFAQLIEIVAKENRIERLPRGTGFNFKMEGLSPDIGINKLDDKNFDQQAALNLLAQHTVTMDAEHSLKSPDPKAAALEAVKALKGNIRSA